MSQAGCQNNLNDVKCHLQKVLKFLKKEPADNTRPRDKNVPPPIPNRVKLIVQVPLEIDECLTLFLDLSISFTAFKYRYNCMCAMNVGYGSTGCGVFKRGVQNQKDFWLRINIFKGFFLNFENWTNGGPQKFEKIRVFKVDYFILPLFLVPKLRSVTQNEWKKHPYIFFLLLVQK